MNKLYMSIRQLPFLPLILILFYGCSTAEKADEGGLFFSETKWNQRMIGLNQELEQEEMLLESINRDIRSMERIIAEKKESKKELTIRYNKILGQIDALERSIERKRNSIPASKSNLSHLNNEKMIQFHNELNKMEELKGQLKRDLNSIDEQISIINY